MVLRPLRARVVTAAVLLAAATTLPSGVPQASAAGLAPASAKASAAEPGVNAVDVSQVTVTNTSKRLRVSFDYATTFTPPDPSSAGDVTKPYWWGATIYFDTNKRHKGPEFAAFLTNQCGTGYTIGKVRRHRSHGESYYAVTPEWEGGCGPRKSCVRTAKVRYADGLGSLTSITFRKVKGCFDAKKVRISAEFQTGPFGATQTNWQAGRDLLDEFPGTGLKEYTGWTKQGSTTVFPDLSPGLVKSTSSSKAP